MKFEGNCSVASRHRADIRLAGAKAPPPHFYAIIGKKSFCKVFSNATLDSLLLSCSNSSGLGTFFVHFLGVYLV